MDNNQEKSNHISDLEQSSSGLYAQPAPPEEGVPSLEELQGALAAKTEEAGQMREKYLRLAAEFENYKKLAIRDQREHVRFANEQLVKELLPVIDNLERAIQSSKDKAGGDALTAGVELTLKQALEAFEKFDVRPIKSVGEPFNPVCHQAVVRVESHRLPENSVVEEFQRGYYLHDRVLRAAMVSVATSPAVQSEDDAVAGEPATE